MSNGDAEEERRIRSKSVAHTSAGAHVRAVPPTRREFCVAFERCFRRVYAYVSRRVDDVATCERIVGAVLAANLDVLVDGGPQEEEVRRLKRSSDRWIGLEAARRLPAGKLARPRPALLADDSG